MELHPIPPNWARAQIQFPERDRTRRNVSLNRCGLDGSGSKQTESRARYSQRVCGELPV